MQGFLELGSTTFTILILLVGAIIFIGDTDRLVLKPLERMVHLVGCHLVVVAAVKQYGARG